ncbi:hypothetical protein JAAARDRAFT_210276 [Jaapia argillacea MUCL 33604]|uniref:Uncharacterized protein n=1 Tax=Jaapia argillacea MUCL 33604 TaxID=933084 RepID=A0A067PE69_9AGAM|nr:hypothetical protein JAAARDRAFT_210276 [Jaapia argillacea MUCL 33604]
MSVLRDLANDGGVLSGHTTGDIIYHSPVKGFAAHRKQQSAHIQRTKLLESLVIQVPSPVQRGQVVTFGARNDHTKLDTKAFQSGDWDQCPNFNLSTTFQSFDSFPLLPILGTSLSDDIQAVSTSDLTATVTDAKLDPSAIPFIPAHLMHTPSPTTPHSSIWTTSTATTPTTAHARTPIFPATPLPLTPTSRYPGQTQTQIDCILTNHDVVQAHIDSVIEKYQLRRVEGLKRLHGTPGEPELAVAYLSVPVKSVSPSRVPTFEQTEVVSTIDARPLLPCRKTSVRVPPYEVSYFPSYAAA